jgi:serine/threonine-protein kinase MRCK
MVNMTERESQMSHQISSLEQQVAGLQSQLEQEREISQNYHTSQLEQQVIELQQQQPNWERQVAEIIDWVANEKDARNHLQQMTACMTKEMDSLKQQHQHDLHRHMSVSGTVDGHSSPISEYANMRGRLQSSGSQHQQNSKYGTTTWQERRSARVDKQELLQLQLDLANEIEDKQRIQTELARVQRELNAVVQDLHETKAEVVKVQEQKRRSVHSAANSNLFASSGLSSPPAQHHLKPESALCLPLETHFLDSGSEADTSTEEPSSSSASDLKSQTLSHVKQHSFCVRTFVAPLKCNHCTSLMVGLIRQGLVCEVCGFACHVTCANQGQQQCPCDDARQRPVGIDPQKGIGTAYEGYVKIPRARGGVRKGWVRMFVVVCDFKLFLYDLNSSSEMSGLTGSSNGSGSDVMAAGVNVVPFVSVNTLIDMRCVIENRAAAKPTSSVSLT